MLTDESLRDLLAALSSPDPTPGGGSASAAASAIGASLLLMVASLPKSRLGSDHERAALSEAARALGVLQRQLTDAVDADAAAYDRVDAAYGLPKGTNAEKAARMGAIQRALIDATDVPLDVMRWSAASLTQTETVATHGHRAAVSDVAVGAELLKAGMRGARINVETNLRQVTDVAYRKAVEAEVDRLTRGAERSIASVSTLLAQ